MKIILSTFLLIGLLVTPVFALAQGLVPCGNEGQPRCELADIGQLLLNVFNFVVFYLATPLAGLGIVIGGILIMISGGPGGKNPVTGIASPNMYSTGTKIITGAVLGVFLIWTSWIIVDSVLKAIGYTGV